MRRDKFISGIIIAMMLAMTIMFSGCGSQPSTLEEYIDSNEDAKATLESMSSGSKGLDVTVDDNTIIYTYTYSDTLDSSVIDAIADELEKTIDKSSSTFTTLADTMEEETKIEGISVKVVYLNGDGSEIFSKEY